MLKLPLNQIVCGDALEVLKTFPDNSINCCISSPPYWALRDYGVPGQLGLEPTFEEYIDKLCTIYDEVFRVLRKDGCVFVNLGDTYNNGTAYNKQSGLKGASRYNERKDGAKWAKHRKTTNEIPIKSLCLIPQRFAIEMVNRGWILRNVIIWSKPNPMPSSAKDRFTVGFEQIYFFVKSNEPLCWVRPDGKMVLKKPDHKSGIEGLDWKWGIRKGQKVKLSLWQGHCYFFEPQYEPQSETSHPRYAAGESPPPAKPNSKELNRPGYENWRETTPVHKLPLGRNMRSTWVINTEAFPDAHFATFPRKLVEPMIKAGCPEFVCEKCGQARKKIFNTEVVKRIRPNAHVKYVNGGPSGQPDQTRAGIAIKGFHYSDCGCGAKYRPGIVLDMFAGSCTTGQVAAYLKRDYIMIELNPDYIEMGERRIAQGETSIPVAEQKAGQMALFERNMK
jgi:site-specific DNA-methyltransferase (adenine-specific)